MVTPPNFLSTLGSAEGAELGCDEDRCELGIGSPAVLKTPWSATAVCEHPYDFTSDTASQRGNALLPDDALALQGNAAGLRVAPQKTAFVATGTTSEAPVSTTSDVNALYGSRLSEMDNFFSAIGTQGEVPKLNDRYSVSDFWAKVQRSWKVNFLNDMRDKRVQWASNGIRVGSCEEYAYEKLYRYNRFNDLRAAVGNEDRAVFDLAYGNNAALDPNREAKLANENLTSRKPIEIDAQEGMTIGDLLTLAAGEAGTAWQPGNPTGDPKNLFHSQALGEVYNINYWDNSVFKNVQGTADEIRACKASSTTEAVLESCLMGVSPLRAPGIALFDGPVLMDKNLQSLVKSRINADRAAPQVHDWAWHAKMSQSLQSKGFGDEQLAAFDRMRNEYQRLLAERHKVVTLLRELSKRKSTFALDYNQVEIGIEKLWEIQARSLVDIVVNEVRQSLRFGLYGQSSVDQALDEARISSAELESLMRGSSEQLGKLRTMSSTTSQSSTMDRRMSDEQTRAAVAMVNEKLGRSQFVIKGDNNATHSETLPGSFSEQLKSQRSMLLKVFFIDRAIERLLVIAKDAGCFDTQSQRAVNACDWSPKVFVEALTFNYETEKAAAFDACVSATGGFPFATVRSSKLQDQALACGKSIGELKPYYPTSSLPTVWDYFTKDTYSFDELINLRRQRCAAAALEAFNAGRQLRQAGESGGASNDSMGSDVISLWMERDFSYGLDNIEQHFTGAILKQINNQYQIPKEAQLAARMHGRLAAGMTILGAKASILDATADVTLSQKEKSAVVTVKMLGGSLLPQGDNAPVTESAPVSVRNASVLIEARARFMAGPIPMSVTVGAAGEAGIDFAPMLDYNVDQLVWDDFSDKKVEIAGGAIISPYIGIDAYAQAAIDAGVASAGVEAYISVLHASMPFSASFHVKGSERLEKNKDTVVISMPSLLLNFKTKLDVRLRALDGRISLFAKVGAWKFSKTFRHTIFEWHGPRYDKTVFDYEFAPKVLGGQSIALRNYESDANKLIPPPPPRL